MISLRRRVNEALCGRNGRRRRVWCTQRHRCRIRVVSRSVSRHLPRHRAPCRVRVAYRDTVSVSYPAPRRCRVSNTESVPHPCRIPWRRVRVASASPRPRRIRRAVSYAASTSPPTAPSVSPPAACRIPRCRRRGAAARSRPQQRSEMPRRRTARATGHIVTPVARRRGQRRRSCRCGASDGRQRDAPERGDGDGRRRRVSRPGRGAVSTVRRSARRQASRPGDVGDVGDGLRSGDARQRTGGASLGAGAGSADPGDARQRPPAVARRALTRRRAVGRRLSTLGGPLRGEAGPPGAPASAGPGPQEGSGR